MNKIVLSYVVWDSVKPQVVQDLVHLLTVPQIYAINFTVGSLLPMARNTAISKVYSSFPDFTHLLFVDGDVVWVTPTLVKNLLEADKDLIAPVSVQRKPPFTLHALAEDIEPIVEELKKPQDERQILKVNGLGFSCCLIKREVLDRTAEKIGTGYTWITLDRQPRDSFFDEIEQAQMNLRQAEYSSDEEMLDEHFKCGLKLGLTAHHGALNYGEDFAFCIKARKAGFDCFMHTGLQVGHIGDCICYPNDYLDYLYAKQHNIELLNRFNAQTLTWQTKG